MRLLIAGGGTGGHLYPGIAVAEELLGRPGEHRVQFAGTDRGLEARVLGDLALPFRAIRSAGLVGKGWGDRGRALAQLVLGYRDGSSLVKCFRPDACLGVGGYVSVPVVIAARLRRVATAVQEQNAWPGLANRTLARWVDRVYAGVPEAAVHLPTGRTRVTGNPLRRAFLEKLPYRVPVPGEPFRLLVLGGSLGAAALNAAVPDAVARLDAPVVVVHQTGPGGVGPVRARYGHRVGVEVVEYLDDIRAAYDRAHLVVARAGALTVAELAAAGRPALLVPYPHAAGGHQEANARAAAAAGAARWMTQGDLTGPALAEQIEALASDPCALETMAGAAAATAPRTAAADIVDDLEELVESRKRF